MRFLFKANTKDGKTRKGIVDAVNKNLAIKTLQENNLTPISVDEERGVSQLVKTIQKTWEGVGKKDLLIFFRQLSTLIKSKVPVVYSLRAIGDQIEHRYLQSIIKDLASDVEEGATFADALAKYPDVFKPMMVSVIRAGEVSGNLHTSIEYVANNVEKSYIIGRKIRSALMYPLFVIGAAFIVGFLSVTFIIPRLMVIIRDVGADLPWHTMLLMHTGDFMEKYWWAVLIIIGGVIVGTIYYVKSESGKREWDRIQLSIPIFGKLFKYYYLVRFASNLAVLVSGGVPIVKSLIIVAEVVDNHTYQGVILRCADEVKAGGNMSTVIRNSEYMPEIIGRILQIGEETGKIDEALTSISNFYEREMDDMVKNISVLIEPVMIIFLGIGVAVLAFSILMPIYSIVQYY